MTREPSLSVVVATSNRADRLADLLASLRAQTLPVEEFEVIVVNDGSRDGTRDLLAHESEPGGLRLRVVERPRPGGPAAARNDGWPVARGPVVAFTDDDCVADRDWLRAGLEACDEHPAALVQGRTQPIPEEVDRVGAFSRTLEIDRLGPYFQCCNMFYPRTVLERLGGFDARAYPRSGEDADLAWRALTLGTPAVFASDARVFHAVNQLGPLGKLRVAARWSDSMGVYARFPALRANVFTHKIFWKHSHYLLVRALLALPLPRRLRPIGLLLAWPYLSHVMERIRQESAGNPLLVPYYVLHDLVELLAVARGAVRYRTLLL
jgi:GT2 family glycosyltransferase